MEDVKRWRRDLHQIPELGLKEYQTAEYLRHELEQMGYHWESIIETGTLVYIDYGLGTDIWLLSPNLVPFRQGCYLEVQLELPHSKEQE